MATVVVWVLRQLEAFTYQLPHRYTVYAAVCLLALRYLTVPVASLSLTGNDNFVHFILCARNKTNKQTTVPHCSSD